MPDWLPDWSGETCVIVASGPSAKNADLESVRGRARVIVINTSWQLAPWADLLFGADMLWWQSVKGCPEFGGIKVTQDKLAAKAYGLHLIQGAPRCYRIVTAPAGIVGWFGNSGGYALNVAVQCRPSVIKLVGFDYSAKRGLHWHGPHGTGLNNPRPSTLEKWRAVLDEQAGLIASLGIEVVNCSPESALRNYQKGSLT